MVAYLLEQGIADSEAAAVRTWVESADPHKPVLVARGVVPVNGVDGCLHLVFEEREAWLENDRKTTERQLLHLRRMQERGAHFTVAHAKRLHELEEASHVARERETELQFLRQDLMERVQMARQSAIVVVGEVHPDAVFVIHGKMLTLDEPHGPVRIESRRDGPCMLPLVGADPG